MHRDDVGAEVESAINAIQGRLWMIGWHHGRTCFRQAAVDGVDGLQPNGLELFLWYWHPQKDRGWYVSPKVGTICPNENSFMAWGSACADGVECFPPKLHISYWSKKPCPYMDIRWQHEFADELVSHLHADIADLQKRLEARPPSPRVEKKPEQPKIPPHIA